MRLVKLQDLTNRQVSSYELLSKYIFDGKFPEKFVSGKMYKAGDFAYMLNSSGDIDIYICIRDGIYSAITKDGWEIANLDQSVKVSVSNYILENKDEIQKEIIDNIDTSNIVYPDLTEILEKMTKVVEEDSFKFYGKPDVKVIDKNTLELPVSVDDSMDEVTVYIDRVCFNAGHEFKLDGNKITSNEFNLTNDSDVLVSVFKKNENDSKLIYTTVQDVELSSRTTEIVVDPMQLPVATNIIVIKFDVPAGINDPYNSKGIYKSMVFDLYSKGKYIPEKSYTYGYSEDGSSCTIEIYEDEAKKYDMSLDFVSDEVSVIITASLNKMVKISKVDVPVTANLTVEKGLIDLKYRDYDRITNWCVCYDDSKVIPNYATEIYNGKVHITKPEYRLTSQNFVLSYKTIDIDISYENDTNRSEEYQENVVVNTGTVKDGKVVIPFPIYDRDINNILVFKHNGDKHEYISESKYYIYEQGYIQFYDDAVVDGDVIVFQMLSDDKSITSYIKNYTFLQEEIDNGIKIPCLDYDKEMFDLLVFTVDGKYIPSENYIINDNNWFTFNGKAPIGIGDTLEFVFLQYITLRTDTVIKRYRHKVKEAKSLVLPFVYNGDTDSFFIMTKDGCCVDACKYSVSTDGNVRSHGEELFPVNENVDIFLCRALDSNPLITRIPEIRKNLTPTI